MTRGRVAFIGAGNMAAALVGGLMRAGTAASSLVAADPSAAQRQKLTELGVPTTDDNAVAVRDASVIVLAVKPQVLGSVVTELRGVLRPDQLIVSIAAGVPTSAIRRWCGGAASIVRCMPNTPALYGVGISALFANDDVAPQQAVLAEEILRAAGEVVWVERESELDAVTAVSGSGPAYFFYLMEAMTEAAMDLGLSADLARRLVLETAYGAAVMAREGDIGAAELRRNVTSPGGTTERALSVLDQNDVRTTFRDAIGQAAVRSRELASEFGGT